MTFDEIERQLQQEEQAGLPTNRDELAVHHETRAHLAKALSELQRQLNGYKTRLFHLPQLAVLSQVDWARATQGLPGLALCVIDTTGIRQDSDIVRITLVDGQGNVLFDRIVSPQRQRGEANTAYTGITSAQISQAPPLASIWTELQAVVEQRHVLAYNGKFLVERLHENAQAYGLAPLRLSGECLMEHASRYYGVTVSLKLTDICGRIGHVLPQPALALERAIAQLAFLHAMAKGILNVSVQPKTVENDDLDDAHPF
ncbi:MAG: hypothetical protein E6J34_00300 [Chloroflexi bacterium]|nr:MAG: hypothetical protein E6J34_00300 [Chloroflexota bacterium]